MSRYVVLRHEMLASERAGVHWDLMLEHGGRLRTWALALEPAAGIEIVADALADHRLEYLQYEGPIGGDRGEVRQWDQGRYEMQIDAPDEIVVSLEGERLIGTAELRRDQDESQRWTFEFSPSS